MKKLFLIGIVALLLVSSVIAIDKYKPIKDKVYDKKVKEISPEKLCKLDKELGLNKCKGNEKNKSVIPEGFIVESEDGIKRIRGLKDGS